VEILLSQLNLLSRSLARFPAADGIHVISPPQRFEGGEEAYDATVGRANRPDLLASGTGAWRLAAHYAQRPLRSWLEMGAGGGTCTLGLVAASPARRKIITDTSPVFLDIIRRKLAAADISDAGCAYATLAGEHLDHLPPRRLDAIFVASAVHHVSDWRAFLAAAARALRPGGVLVIQEPFREGYLLLNMAMEIALAAGWAAELSPEDVRKIEHCRNSTYYLSDTTLEKIGEDKHNFLADEVATASQTAGFARCVVHRNAHFEAFGREEEIRTSHPCSLLDYLLSFLGAHHRVSDAGIEVLTRRLAPALGRLDHLFMQGDGPALMACVVFVK
jgi:ubiquinone/menaquinone biosynthesis C-methylase UbiE